MQTTTPREKTYVQSAGHRQAEMAPQTLLGNAVKRGFDILISSGLLLLLSPLYLFLGLWIKRDSPGPVFYRGPRLGRQGKIFTILKFRTMHESPESYQGPRVTAQGDPRVTPVGRWLRDTKLNELPQFWNVLKGEMSLVGPRPEDPEIGESWSPEVRAEVLSVRPGVTSPASVLYRDEERMLVGGKLMDTYLGAILPSKLRLDQLYVRHRSFLLDMDVMLWTLLVLMPMVGAAPPIEDRLFLGPLSKLMRRYVRWFMIDLLVTFVAIGLTGLFWRSMEPLDVGVTKSLWIAFGFALLYSLVAAAMGVNRVVWSRASLMDAIDLLPAVMVSTVIALVMNYYWSAQPLLPPAMIIWRRLCWRQRLVVVRYRSRLLSASTALS
jgi:lipopolysaccharide/colanic/teichoic acid biosynthesis glycosyltransferase